jgi:hypothetical protein
MSIESMAAALHHSKATGTARLVLIGIANHDGDGGAFPAMATLAKYANVDIRNARNAVRRLEALGEVRTLTNGGALPDRPAIYQPNRYELLIRCPYFCDGTKNHRDSRQALFSEDAAVLSDEARPDADGIPDRMPASAKPSFNQPSHQTKKIAHVKTGPEVHSYAESGWCISCSQGTHKEEKAA